MTPDEIIQHMEQINKTAALFDWLNLLDGHTVGGSLEEILASTCELTVEPPKYDDVIVSGD